MLFIFKQNKNLHYAQLSTVVELVDRGDLLNLNFRV
nr:MAG TPA: hypothetical protein [Caudoviricetes sp.]